MANFQGKWETDTSAPIDRIDELMDKVGVDKAMQQTFKDAVSTVEYTVNGNTVTVKTSSSAFPGKERVQTFTAGVPFDDVGLDGTPFKATVTIKDDNTMIDKGKSDKYGEFETTRTVSGNVMKSVINMAGVTASYQMKRV